MKLSGKVEEFLKIHRDEVNTLVRSSSYPGFDQETAVSNGLLWMEKIFLFSGNLGFQPLVLSLQLTQKGLLQNNSNFLAPIESWIRAFPRAFSTDSMDVLIDWTHLLLRLRPYPEVLNRVLSWVTQVSGKDLNADAVRRLLTAASWLAGLSPWRQAGMESLDALPVSVSRELKNLATGTSNPGIWSSLKINPLGNQSWTRLIGGVQGFSGEWASPPKVLSFNGKLLVQADSRTWEIVSDYFGSLLVPYNEEFQQNPSDQKNTVQWRVAEDNLISPKNLRYPFPYGDPPGLEGVELSSGLAAVVSLEFFSVVLTFRGIA